eukprot:scaffold5240_cov125-Skeletonema_dohrnii-CCMP3373.AAC.4
MAHSFFIAVVHDKTDKTKNTNFQHGARLPPVIGDAVSREPSRSVSSKSEHPSVIPQKLEFSSRHVANDMRAPRSYLIIRDPIRC